MICRHCGSPLGDCLLDLGSAPFSNAYLSEAALRRPEAWYPLRVMVCSTCWLVRMPRRRWATSATAPPAWS